jgi:hypothetical protein
MATIGEYIKGGIEVPPALKSCNSKDGFIGFFTDCIDYYPNIASMYFSDTGIYHIAGKLLLPNLHIKNTRVVITDLGQIYPNYVELYKCITGWSYTPDSWNYQDKISLEDIFIYKGTYMLPISRTTVDLLYSKKYAKYIIVGSDAVKAVGTPIYHLPIENEEELDAMESIDTTLMVYPKSHKVKKTIKEHNFLKIKLLTIK